MTIQDKWNCFKARLGFGEIDPLQGPELSIEERITAQVEAIKRDAHWAERAITTRVEFLEKRSESVDAFYVKTVATALSERQDAVVNKIWRQWADDSKAASARVDALIKQIDTLVVDLREANNRITAQGKAHSALIAKLRAGLGEG